MATNLDYQGPAAWRAGIEAALAGVVDPELGIAVTDLGLIRRIAIDDATCAVEMTMTSAACPAGDMIAAEVEQTLAALLPEDMATRVTLVWAPPWAPEQMSEGARRALGW